MRAFLAKDNNNFNISVEDTGIGLENSMFAKLGAFNIKDNKEENNAGLGLLISNYLANVLGPEKLSDKGIFVTSKKGKGSNFVFTVRNCDIKELNFFKQTYNSFHTFKKTKTTSMADFFQEEAKGLKEEEAFRREGDEKKKEKEKERIKVENELKMKETVGKMDEEEEEEKGLGLLEWNSTHRLRVKMLKGSEGNNKEVGGNEREGEIEDEVGRVIEVSKRERKGTGDEEEKLRERIKRKNERDDNRTGSINSKIDSILLSDDQRKKESLISLMKACETPTFEHVDICMCPKFLIVDDHYFNIEVIILMLKGLGIGADYCSSGVEAVEKITVLLERKFNLISHPKVHTLPPQVGKANSSFEVELLLEEAEEKDQIKEKKKGKIEEGMKLNSKIPSEGGGEVGLGQRLFGTGIVNGGKGGGTRGMVEDFCSKCKFYKCILMDIQMPVKDGIQTTKELMLLFKKYKLKTPILAVSALSNQNVRNEAKEAGVRGYYEKPITKKILQKLVEEYVN